MIAEQSPSVADVPVGYDAADNAGGQPTGRYSAQSPDNPYPEPRRIEADPPAEAMPTQADPFGITRGSRKQRQAQQAVATEAEPQAAADAVYDTTPDASLDPPGRDFNQGPGVAAAEIAHEDTLHDNFAPPTGTAGREPASVGSAATSGAGGEFHSAAERQIAANSSRTEEGTGRPGEKQLEGAQAPSLTIEKRAPAEIQVGKPATFTITVRNHGQVAAHGVEVHDVIPQGTRFVGSTPPAKRGPQGELIWDLGSVKPASESTMQVQLMPMTEGEIGSVATIQFRANASARTTATRPQLTLDVSAPSRVMIGSDVTFKIKLSNPGTGAATGVVLTETIPPGLKHAAGGELEFEVGTLKPGEHRELELPLTAAQPGPVTNLLTARADANVAVETRTQCEVIAPGLKIGVTGPKRRYLERSAIYNISVTNPGTAATREVELAAVLPKGLKFVEANNAGQYDGATGTVYWSLEELPPGETGTVSVTALPIEPGELRLHVKGRAQQGLTDEHDEIVTVEGIAAILFELVDINDPIEVGGETTYEIRVINQGSKSASDVRVVALLPPQLQAVSAEGPARHVIDGQRVLFDPVLQLAPKADMTYTVKVKALGAGDLRLRVQVLTDEIRTPITKEESTRVYSEE